MLNIQEEGLLQAVNKISYHLAAPRPTHDQAPTQA